MAMGLPVAFQDELGIQSQASLGIDCQSNNSASIVSEMRLLLQSSRNRYNDEFGKVGKVPSKVNKTVEEAFNMGTIQGARAIGMEDKIGTLAVGKKADMLIFDGQSPSMVCAAQHDPVAAVVLHSSPADIEVVIVDGVIRKRNRVLGDVKITSEANQLWSAAKEAGDKLAWEDVSKELIKRRVEVQKKFEKIDMEAAKAGVMKGFHIDERVIVDKV
jgi:formylmethanofuran dehydrogenase subunit A